MAAAAGAGAGAPSAIAGSALDTVVSGGGINVTFLRSFSSSTWTSRSMVFFSSSLAFLNSPSALPSVLLISGSFRFGYKPLKCDCLNFGHTIHQPLRTGRTDGASAIASTEPKILARKHET